MECVFCAIAVGRAPAHVVYEDAAVVGFLDRRPVARGHTLVIPRRHVAELWDLDGEEAAAIMRAAVDIARWLRGAFAPAGLSLAQSNGAAAGQEVPHVHLHLVPREVGDGLSPQWRGVESDASTLHEVAQRVRDARDNRTRA